MDNLFGVLKMIMPVLLMIGIGMFCRVKGVVQKQGLAGLKSFAVNICLPAVLFRAFYSADYGIDILIIAAAMFLVCMLALVTGFLIKRVSSAPKLVPFLLTGFEAGMLGYALYTLMYGADAVTHFATVDLGQVLFVFTVYLSVLRRRENAEQYGLMVTIKSMASSPVIIAILAGVVTGITGLGSILNASAAGGIVNGVLDFIAAPTAAVILFVVGYDLKLHRQSIKAAFVTAAVRIALMGMLCAAVLLFLGALINVTEQLKWAFIIMFILPPPFVLPVFTSGDKEASYGSAAISIYTVFTLAAFTVIAFITA